MIGSICFGAVKVRGRSLVPSPPTRITACTATYFLVFGTVVAAGAEVVVTGRVEVTIGVPVVGVVVVVEVAAAAAAACC
jgi:hypothetical protein